MSKKIIIKPLSDRERRAALLDFSDLLARDTKEAEWQVFFENYPNILTNALSLQLTGFFSQVELFSGKPDYVFYRSIGNSLGDYGVIELKRNEQSILGHYSTKHIIPSPKLVTAKYQTERYLESIRKGEFLNTEDFFVAGNRSHAFIIIGHSSEILKKCRDEMSRQQFANILPAGFHLYTYDEVFEHFVSSGPPIVKLLHITNMNVSTMFIESVVEVVNPHGIHMRPAMATVDLTNNYNSMVYIESPNSRPITDAKSIMQTSMLAATCGTRLKVFIVGNDAQQLFSAFVNIKYQYEDEPTPIYKLIERKSRVISPNEAVKMIEMFNRKTRIGYA